MPTSLYNRFGKRFVDIVAATTGLAILAPFMAVIAAAVCLRLGRPVLFKQLRVGLNGTKFLLRKFRTMSDDVDGDGRPLPDAERLTAFGRWLRRWSLDELPELVSVVAGDMSLVGPRPLPVKYMSRYSRQQARRHEVSPGLTGLAQVRGRNTLSWEDRFALDVWYVDNRSGWLDLKILLTTLALVLKGTGISQPGQSTMTEFMGSSE